VGCAESWTSKAGGNIGARILKGANAGDIPVQTDEFELVINSKTAAALSVKIPERVLARATKIVDRLHSERQSRFRTALGGLRAT
jgi:ABC-type uncharacterized transport system substrate-binding protein